MSRIWFTSDTHFFHDNIIKHCNRPWTNSDEMNQALIEKWNHLVTGDDVVYHLGDFTCGKHERILKSNQQVFDQLNGQKHLITGNHDSLDIHKQLGWKSISNYFELKIWKRTFVLFHYPMIDWNHAYHGSIHLFGHCHGRMHPGGRSIEVGVDCQNYMPISIDEVITLMESVPHHGQKKVPV